MDLRRAHETLTSLAVSAMLTSAFLASVPNGMTEAGAGPQPQAIMNALSAIHASGWTGTQELTPPVGVAMPQSAAAVPAAFSRNPAWTADQQKKIATLMANYGKMGPLNKAVTVAFGLSTGDEALNGKILTFTEAPLLHAYILLPDSSVLFVLRDSVTTWYYHLDANQMLIAAVTKIQGQAPTVIPMPDAEKNSRVELTYWAAVADKH